MSARTNNNSAHQHDEHADTMQITTTDLVFAVVVDSAPALFAVSVLEGPGGAGKAVTLLQVATAAANGFFSCGLTASEIEIKKAPDEEADEDAAAAAAADAMDTSDDANKNNDFAPAIGRLLQLMEKACSKTAEDVTLGFSKQTTDDHGAGLRMTVKRKDMLSGVVTNLFSATLTQQDDKKNGLLDFSLRMLQRQTNLVSKLQSLKNEYAQLEQARDAWQETAQQLEGQWETEKTQLLRNFCDLYAGKQNDSQKRMEQLQADIQKLELQVLQDAARPAMSNNDGNPRKRAAPAPLPEPLQNVPGDADQEMFDSETAQRLAEGRRVATTKTKKTSATAAKKDPPQQQQPQQQRKRRNETLGTVEYFDVDAALEDVNADGNSSDTEDEGKQQPTKKPAAKQKKVRAPAKKKKEVARSDVADDSSTDSENSMLDATMQGDILAQLAKMK